jgi:hypothetical protein
LENQKGESISFLRNIDGMVEKTFIESDLVFAFPEHWGVREYDNHRFYKNISGLGLKGVDFLLVDPSGAGHLYLMEVKNYRTRVREGIVYEAPLKSPEELAATIAMKYEHTLRAIRAVHLYYQRKWWYRLLNRVIRKSQYTQYDSVFWTQAYELARQPSQHTFLLWLETETEDQAYEQQLQNSMGLQIAFKIGRQIHPYPPGIIVQG